MQSSRIQGPTTAVPEGLNFSNFGKICNFKKKLKKFLKTVQEQRTISIKCNM